MIFKSVIRYGHFSCHFFLKGASWELSEELPDPKEKSSLIIKGADTAVLPNCTHGPVEETNKIVEQFAKEGLRTLVYAYKTITRDELNLFSEKLEAAKQSIVNR